MTDTPADFEALAKFRARTRYEELRKIRVKVQPISSWVDAGEETRELCLKAERATLIAEWKAGIRPCPSSGTGLTEMAIAALEEHRRMVGIGDATPDHPDWGTCVQAALDKSPFAPPEDEL